MEAETKATRPGQRHSRASLIADWVAAAPQWSLPDQRHPVRVRQAVLDGRTDFLLAYRQGLLTSPLPCRPEGDPSYLQVRIRVIAHWHERNAEQQWGRLVLADG